EISICAILFLLVMAEQDIWYSVGLCCYVNFVLICHGEGRMSSNPEFKLFEASTKMYSILNSDGLMLGSI
ncbi:hypothetical protein CEJ83_20420, partial [Acinetobacter baumannii]